MDRTIYRMVVTEGAAKDRRYYVREDAAALGRDSSCEIAIDDESLAGRHLLLQRVDGGIRASRCEHAPQVLCNGDPLAEDTPLHQGDVLDFGALSLQFQQVDPLPHYDGRRTPPLARLAVAGIAAVVLVQVLALCLLGLARRDRWSMAKADDAPAEGAAPPDPARLVALTNELTEVETTLRTLEEARARQPIEKVWEGTEAEALSRRIQEARGEADKLDTELKALQAVTAPDAVPGEPSTGKEMEVLKEMKLARQAIDAGRLAEADGHLARAETMAPDKPTAFVTRARLYERRGMYPEAVAQWDEVLKRVEGTRFLDVATAERTRLARQAREHRRMAPPPQEEPGPAPQPEPDGVGEPAPPPAEPVRVVGPVEPPPAEVTVEPVPQQRLRIISTRREKFPAQENYEEIRLVFVTLQPRKSMGRLDAGAVTVSVRFFDLDPESGAIHPSGVPSPAKGLEVEGDWSTLDQRTVRALYMVPQGFRDDEQRRTGSRRRFYGYVVQVHCDGVIQDESAFPASLLQRSRRWM